VTNNENKVFRIVGSIELEKAAPQPPVEQPATSATLTFSIMGNLVSVHYGYPLPGLKVSAYVMEPISTSEGEDSAHKRLEHLETLLGEAISDSGGHFNIQFQDTLLVRQKLCVLTQFADSSIVLKVWGNDGQLYYISETLSASSGSVVVTLPVTLPEADVTTDTWAALGARLEDARITQVNIFAQQLAAPDGQTMFADWNLEMRQAVLNQLEQAFLDPQHILREYASPLPTFSDLRTPGALEAFLERLQPNLENPEVQTAFADFVGKAHSFSDLFSVDWTMDLNDFRQGNVGLAVNKFDERYRGIGDVIGLFPRYEDDLTRYRDYLRAIWPTWITKVVYVEPQGWTEQKALDQLRDRFHQNFFTLDTSQQPANKVLISILTEILTAAKGNIWGFGIAPASIQPQGTRTPREYLDYLIGLTGLSARELGLRYRLDVTRPDSALSSPVQENIATLQGFYRDSFQCDLEPVHVDPDVLNQPIVPDKLQGKAPFFLHYDEWLRQQSPFYSENFFDVRRTLTVDVVSSEVAKLRNWLKAAIQHPPSVPTAAQWRADWQFVWDVWDISDKLNEGHTQYYRGEYLLALNAYLEASGMAYRAFQNKLVSGFDIASKLAGRKKMSIKNIKELALFMMPPAFGPSFEYNLREYDRDDMVFGLVYYVLYVIPVCLGDTYLALGNYEKSVFHYGQATRFPVGTARETDSSGYRPEYSSSYDFNPAFPLYHFGDRPYTVNLYTYRAYPVEGDVDQIYSSAITYSPIEKLALDLITKYVHPVEAKYFRLRHANAMLEWADALYRTNDASSIQRARELYKGVSFLHGDIPPICPKWPRLFGHGIGIQKFINQHENPAFASQKSRARKGFYQIEARLNYYGERDDLVPVLRYRPLKETADRFTALAKSAQQDFLLYLEKMETALIERMKLSNLLQKASLQANVAQEQIKVVEFNVTVAQEQVKNIESQIAAKENEIRDADSLFSQFKDFVNGMKNTFTSLPEDTQSAVKSGFTSEVKGKELVGEGMLGLGAGASIMTGFAIFGVAGYMSMSSMADASNRRSGELRALREKALPMAQAQVDARKHELNIANYQKQIAQADNDLARDLITFEDNRMLNVNFWANLGQIMNRMLRRYLELGARMSWLAERSLAYEQDRVINIIRFDYFPEKLQGVTGADLLQADLAELEAIRIEGIKRSVPVKHTFSLARDFPLQFGQLKQTGRCTFKTEELPFAFAYPGTTGYRIRAVSLLVSQTSFTNPLRGLLINQGISISHPGQPDEHVLVRPPEALPISEFKLQNDMAVYSLPDETLLTFEGSGAETFWEINLPAPANTFGYDGIADVLLTLDLWAQYSPDLYTKQLTNMPKSMRRWIVVSGRQYQSQAIQDLAGAANSVSLDFDISALKLPVHETNRKLKNVAIFFVSPTPLNANAQFSATKPPRDVTITFKQGIAMSNLPPTINDPIPPPVPLNALVDVAADQLFKLSIDKNQNPGVDFSGVTDVVLGVEYTADLN
jgi:hypothetical protein